MALRSSSTASGSGTTPSVAVPAGVAIDDIVILVVTFDNGSPVISGKFPTGFTMFSEGGTTFDGHKAAVGWKRLTAADAGSYTFTAFGFSGDWIAQAFAFSGRHTTTAPTASAVNTVNTGGASPRTISATGLTAVAGDDLVWVSAPDVNATGIGNGHTPPSGYTEKQDVENLWSNLSVATLENASAGATGTVSGTFAMTSGQCAYMAWLVAVPAAPGGGSSLTDNPADNLGITDAVTRVNDMVRTPADNLGITDSASAIKTFDRTVADTLGMTDSLLVEWSGTSSFSPNDNLGITDSLTVAWDRVANINDPLGITDPGQTGDIGANLDDPLGLTDSVSAVQSGAGVANLADNLGLTDAIAVAWDRVATLADSLGMSDASVRGGDIATTLADSLGLTDELSAVFTAEPEPEPPAWIFNTPTRPEWVGSDSLWGRVTRQVGQTVLHMTDGSFRTVPFYDPNEVGVQKAYLGGYVHTISDEIADLLTQAGYGEYLSVVTE